MKTNGYKNRPQKASARTAFWLEARRRTMARGVRLKDALCVFLSGDEVLDAKEAVRHGFSKNNLIAVDLSTKAIETARRRGIVAIHGDIVDVLLSWGEPKIDVIVLDFTFGACDKAYEAIYSTIYSNALSDYATVYVNLMRGRDGLRKGHSFFKERFKWTAGVIGLAYAKHNNIANKTKFAHDLSMRPLSYRDKTTMDGVVFDFVPHNSGVFIRPEDPSIVRKCRAAKAVRTQRINLQTRKAA